MILGCGKGVVKMWIEALEMAYLPTSFRVFVNTLYLSTSY